MQAKSFFLKKIIWGAGVTITLASLSSCHPTKFLQDDEYILSSTKIVSLDKKVKAKDYERYILQQPNSRWFNVAKVPMYIYSLSSAKPSKKHKGLFKKIGEAPVVYDSLLSEQSVANLKMALMSNGYLHPKVDKKIRKKKRNVRLSYIISPGAQTFCQQYNVDAKDSTFLSILKKDLPQASIHIGQPLLFSTLTEERSRLLRYFHNRGYYFLTNDAFSFQIDTTSYHLGAIVNLKMKSPNDKDKKDFEQFRFGNVFMIENGKKITANTKKTVIKPKVYFNHIYIYPDSIAQSSSNNNSYSALAAFPAVKSVYINTKVDPDSTNLLDTYIHIRTKPRHGVGIELDGTNTNGDLGAALVFSYRNRNLLGGSEELLLKLKGAYEAISHLEGYSHHNFLEYSAEAGLSVPSSKLLFTSDKARQDFVIKQNASLSFNSQKRPEFHRFTFTANWGQSWMNHKRKNQHHKLNWLGLNYIYMPWISETFKKEYLEGKGNKYSLLRTAYENKFILDTSYDFTYEKKLKSNGSLPFKSFDKVRRVQLNVDIAGILPSIYSKVTNKKKNKVGEYEIFNIPYSQYARIDFNYSQHLPLNLRNSFTYHLGVGFALPYGNSTFVPYEKRFYVGGANSLRGWNVRTLGPGSYRSKTKYTDFVNQSGDLKLDFNLEWRTQLFGQLHGAIFWDFGNIWNLKKVDNIDGGRFRLSSFYKEIAASYGIGLRWNLDYFLLRFDVGMKAINPAYITRKEHYPIIAPDVSRDLAWHLAIGLPF